MLNRNQLQRFLEKLTPTLKKGFILEVFFNHPAYPLNEENRQQVFSILRKAQQDKYGILLEGPLSVSSIFFYFQANKIDNMKAILIQMAFNLGVLVQRNSQNNFYKIYALKKDLEILTEIANSTEKQQNKETKLTKNVKNKIHSLLPGLEKTSFTMPFTPAVLAELEKSLAQAELGSMMHRQAICALVGNAHPVELFEEIFVSLSELKKVLCPNVDIYQSPWLLNRLLETLDKRVLENVSRHDSGSFRKNFSLNISVKTILTSYFQSFNSSIDSSVRQSVLLEIKQSDIFSNLSSYLVVKSLLKELGYRICIDLVDIDSFPMLDREKLEADFIKLIWTPDLMKENKQESLKTILKENDARRIILCRVDDPNAIPWGQSMGISLFQGYYIQKMLYQDPQKK